MVEGAVTSGVKERPPVPGMSYVAFVVHPPRRGPVVLAIAHAEGVELIVDVVREAIEVEDCAQLVKTYGIDGVTGAPDEGEGDSLAHAVCGALDLLQRRGMQ
jgi:hypothetical protein